MKEEEARKKREKEERDKVPPGDMFKSQTALYSAFDQDGIPTHDDKGDPLSGSKLKNLKKEFSKQQEAHSKYLAKLTPVGGCGGTA